MTPEVSVVIPTLNEQENVAELLRRLGTSLRAYSCEVIFVDDSTDDTALVIEAAALDSPLTVTVLRRVRAVGGLGGAVLDGLRVARGGWAVVMDADLQHDPAVVPRLLEAGVQEEADLVVASRYRAGGSADGLSGAPRRLVSSTTTHLTKALFPRRLAACSDPMSGFFAVRRAAVDLAALRPDGFKILLEILARTQLRVAEVAFCFEERFAGTSSAGLREGARFLRHLLTLRLANRPLAFLVIGASGILPNVAVLWLLTRLGLHYLPAAVLGTQAGILWNFAGAERLVWRDRLHSRTRRDRAWRFVALGEADLLRLPVLVVLVDRLHIGTIIATLLTFALFFLLRFTVADRLIYRSQTNSEPDPVVPIQRAGAGSVKGSSV